MINLLEFRDGNLIMRDPQGNVTLSLNRDMMHGVGFLSGSTVLPGLALPDYPDLGAAPAADHVVTLGPAEGANTILGNWRLVDAEGIAPGDIQYLRDEQRIQTGSLGTTRYRRRHRYAPRLPRGDWFSIGGGPSTLDMYWFNFSVNPYTITTQGSLLPEVGRLWHEMQFIIENDEVKLVRRGRNIAHEYTYLYYPPGFIAPEAYEYSYCFDCAALTIEYQIRLDRFT